MSSHTYNLRGWEVTLSAKPLTEGIPLILIAWFKLIRMDMDTVKRKIDRLSLRNPLKDWSRSGERAVQSLTAGKDL